MDIHGCHQVVLGVARELDALMDQIISNGNFQNQPATIKQKQIVYDASNILHTLSHKYAKIFSTTLVKDVAIFLKRLASETRFKVNVILDGNICPQIKQDTFKCQSDSTMSQIN